MELVNFSEEDEKPFSQITQIRVKLQDKNKTAKQNDILEVKTKEKESSSKTK